MTAHSIPRRRPDAPARLSFGQELFWLLDRASPGLTAYNVPRALRIRGPLNDAALERALGGLIARHDVLRSVYVPEGDHPVQRILPGAAVLLERVDLSSLAQPAREAELRRALDQRAAHHFDLGREVPLRATLFRLGADEAVLFLLTHHLVFDGWSKSVLFRDLGALYAAETGKGAAPAPLPIQFADYAAWERESLSGEPLERLLGYWRRQLHGPLPTLELPTDRPRPAGPTFEGAEREILLSPGLLQSMRRLGQAHGASMYMVLLAGYQTLLHRYSGQDDIIVGSPTAGRGHEDTEDLIGYFANALVLRTSVSGDPTFAELLDRVANTSLDAFEHQDLPLEKLVVELQQGEQLTHAPLFQCVLTMEDTVPAALVLPGTTVTPVDVTVAGTKFDLTLLFSEIDGGLRLRLAYRTALFDGDRIERMLGHLRSLLEGAVAEPERRVSVLPLLTAGERAQLAEWNATAWNEGAPSTVTALVERHAARIPAQAAVVGVDGTLTWGELNARANRIAAWLAAEGVGSGDTVGLCLDRGAAMIAGLLGIFKAGAAYVPLVPDLPAPRLAQQLSESGARAVVTDSARCTLLPPDVKALLLDNDAARLGALPDHNPGGHTDPDVLAYVLFTSGSTGVPKGVAVTHTNLVHYTRAVSRVLGLELGGTATPWHFATVSTLGADLGHTAIFPALCSGGTLHVLPAAVATDPARFADYVKEHPLDLLKITPNHLKALLAGREPKALLPRKWIVLGGEACPWDLARELAGSGACRVLNHYGPTETTVGVTTFEVAANAPAAGATVPIGRPLANTHAYVLDSHGEPAPIGVPGELFIGGAGVTRGYLGKDDLTRERFVTRGGERVYRTGDRVQWLASGALEFLGRADDQVKIRGYRVEPGEIESVLSGHPGMRQVAVVPHPQPDGTLGLLGYICGEGLPDDASLRRWLGTRVAEYMVPGHWVRLDRLPLNANGKVDRKALAAPAAAGAQATEKTQPRNDAERILATLFAEVLKRDAVGIDEDFFALGGHSLLAIRLLGRIAKQFGTRLPLRALFDAPTVEALAQTLDPMTPAELQLAEIWKEVLKRDRVGRDESFFDLGGHSLLAIRVLGRISKTVGVRLSLRALFDAPTIRQLAKVIQDSEMAALLQDIERLDPREAARLLAESPPVAEAP